MVIINLRSSKTRMIIDPQKILFKHVCLGFMIAGPSARFTNNSDISNVEWIYEILLMGWFMRLNTTMQHYQYTVGLCMYYTCSNKKCLYCIYLNPKSNQRLGVPIIIFILICIPTCTRIYVLPCIRHSK